MSETAADATTATVDPNICPECGYAKDSRIHLEGRGLHGHFAGPTEPLSDGAIRKLTHSALVAYAAAQGKAVDPEMTKGAIYDVLGLEPVEKAKRSK